MTMPESAAVHQGTVVADGLAVLVGLSGDPTLATGGTGIYEALKEALRPEIRSGDHAEIALPCVRMADKFPALVVVLRDRATIAPGIGSRQPVQVLTVQWADRPPWVVAVPSDTSTTRSLRTCRGPAGACPRF
jgi:hypothetical protein